MRCAKSSITSALVFCRLNENAAAAKYIEYTTRLASICLLLIFDKRESMDMVKKEKAILRDRQKWERKSVCSCVRCFLSTEPIIRVLQAKTTSAAAATCIVGGRNFIYSLLFFLNFFGIGKSMKQHRIPIQSLLSTIHPGGFCYLQFCSPYIPLRLSSIFTSDPP